MDETKRALVEFTRHIIKTYAWGKEVDCGDVQDTAERLGLLVEVPYDPAVHGENDCDAQPGDPWYVFADALKHQAEPKAEPLGESWTERNRALGRAGFDGGNSGRR